PQALLNTAHAALAASAVRPDYVALVDPDTLEPLAELDRPALLALAAHVGGVRLIDNAILEPTLQPLRPPRKAAAPCSA
ncbi:MAG: pantoate--beta-alanine ligase, partial [Solirubrobacteraceae bacterium]